MVARDEALRLPNNRRRPLDLIVPEEFAEYRAGTHSDLLRQANVWYRCTVYLNSFTTAGKQATTARSRLVRVVILQRRSKSLFAGLPCLWHLA